MESGEETQEPSDEGLDTYEYAQDALQMQGKLSSLESLPAELLQQVAINTARDADLKNLTLIGPLVAAKVYPDGSDVWRRRFLARYDYPFVDSTTEFAVAYKLRRFVLKNSLDFESVNLDKVMIQLEVILDMIIETYNKAQPHLPWPSHSRNLAAFQSTDHSPWMMKLLGCPFYSIRSGKYGQPLALFEAVQLVLSHLVLSLKSPMALFVRISRDNYDLVKVYHFNQTFATLFERLSDETHAKLPSQSTKLPKPRKRSQKRRETKYILNLNELLHIRNFWHRHLVDDTHGLGENTYATMSKVLLGWNSMPRPWTKPLHLPTKLSSMWYGMFSCLHPWPKNRGDLEERQSCAEDWSVVDPMRLEFVTCRDNESKYHWPPAFNEIPAFQQTLPQGKHATEVDCNYLRGTARFINANGEKEMSGQTETNEKQGAFLKYHPFTAARVRGVVHEIPVAATLERQAKQIPNFEHAIPGWKRVVLVMYRVQPRHLISILEHAIEEYGFAYADQAHNTANVWNDNIDSQDDDMDVDDVGHPNAGLNTSHNNTASSISDVGSGNADVADSSNDAHDPGSPEYLDHILAKLIRRFTKQYRRRLQVEARLPERLRANLPPIFSIEHVNQLEDAFIPPVYLSWDDTTTPVIDYAYAYEGVIIPGGQIMMGRWWRVHGSEGLGPGCEVAVGGIGVEVRRVNEEDRQEHENDFIDENDEDCCRERITAGNARDDGVGDGKKVEFVTQINGEETRAVNGCKGLERGPFVFWTCD